MSSNSFQKLNTNANQSLSFIADKPKKNVNNYQISSNSNTTSHQGISFIADNPKSKVQILTLSSLVPLRNF